MSILQFINDFGPLPSRELNGIGTPFKAASKSEIRRWIERGSVEIDGAKATIQSAYPLELQSVVIHPKGKHRTTLQ